MTDEELVVGPIDFVLLEFPEEGLTGEAGAAVLDLVEAGIIRLWDVMIVAKDPDGTVGGVDFAQLAAESLGGFASLAGAQSGLLSDDDIQEAGNALEPGTVAVLIVFENTWAVPFIAAARRSGGQLVATSRIPSDVVIEVLNSMDED